MSGRENVEGLTIRASKGTVGRLSKPEEEVTHLSHGWLKKSKTNTGTNKVEETKATREVKPSSPSHIGLHQSHHEIKNHIFGMYPNSI
jgi:hypothetical protein